MAAMAMLPTRRLGPSLLAAATLLIFAAASMKSTTAQAPTPTVYEEHVESKLELRGALPLSPHHRHRRGLLGSGHDEGSLEVRGALPLSPHHRSAPRAQLRNLFVMPASSLWERSFSGLPRTRFISSPLYLPC